MNSLEDFSTEDTDTKLRQINTNGKRYDTASQIRRLCGGARPEFPVHEKVSPLATRPVVGTEEALSFLAPEDRKKAQKWRFTLAETAEEAIVRDDDMDEAVRAKFAELCAQKPTQNGKKKFANERALVPDDAIVPEARAIVQRVLQEFKKRKPFDGTLHKRDPKRLAEKQAERDAADEIERD